MQLGKNEEAQTLLADLSTLDTSSVYKGLIDSYAFVLDNDMDGALAATEKLRQMAGDRQAEAGAAMLPGAAVVDLAELVEDKVQGIGGNTETGIGNLKHDLIGSAAPHANRNATLFGELDRLA